MLYYKGEVKLNTFRVTPNVDGTAWMVQLEEHEPEDVFDLKEEAIETAERLAHDDAPCKVEIRDINKNVLETKQLSK